MTRAIWGALIIIGMGLTGSASASAEEFKVLRSRKSKRHPLVILAPRKQSARATLKISFGVGSYDDGHQGGLTRLTQQAILTSNAAMPYDELALDLYQAAAELKIETGIQGSSFTLSAPAKSFEALAKRVVPMLLSPRLSPAMFEGARSRTLQDQQNAGVGQLVSMFAGEVFAEEGFGNAPLGKKDSLRILHVSYVQDHIRRFFVPANAVVVVTGKFSSKKMKKLLKRYRGGRRVVRKRPDQELAGRYHLRTYLELHMLAYPVALDGPKTIAAMHLATAIFSEQVQRTFRSRGIVYSSVTHAVHRPWLDFLMITLPIHSEETVPVESLLEAEVEAVRSKLDPETFRRNQSFLLADLAVVDRDPDRLAELLAMGGPDERWLSRKVVDEIEVMTLEDFTAVVKPWLSPQQSIHVAFSPRMAAAVGKTGSSP